jgi:hypothetical protein
MELNQLYCCLIFCYYAFQTPTQHEGKRMITNLSSKDQGIFDKDQSSIITERVDDVPLLIGQMTKMGLQEILDRHIPLTLDVRVLTLVEFVVQRSLREADAKLYGMHPENRKKSTAKPSAERILKTFSKINLTIIQDLAGNVLVGH